MMSDSNKTELIAKFTGITGVEDDRAKFYLESAAWNVDVALSSFYQEDDEASGSAGASEMVEASVPQSAQNVKTKFGTISNLKGEESDSSDDERQSFYTGGSEHGGGQQILGAKKKKPGELVQDMFKSAKEHGAEEVPAGPSSEKPKAANFRGTGYKLGETDDSSEVVRGAPMQQQRGQVDMVLKLWKNGFSIDDGPLRDYQDQQNQEFLTSVKKGEVPKELIRSAQGGEVNLNMEDHREEEYVKPKVAMKAFSGGGNRLGSVTPASVTSAPVSASQAQQNEAAANAAVTVNPSQPTTSLQIRLADGSRLVAKFNHSHRVSDIRTYITTSRPSSAGSNFVLMTTFPNKELTDESQTIEQAKLQNAVIVQRLK